MELRELERAPTPWLRGAARTAEIDLTALDALIAGLITRAGRRLTAPPAAIAVTSVLGWVPLDAAGEVVGNAITYADRRATTSLGDLARRLPDFSHRAGRPLTPELLVAIDSALMTEAPAAWTSLKDHILSSLGAEYGVDTIHAAYAAFYGEEAIRATRRDRNPLPPPAEPDTLCGSCDLDWFFSGVPLVRGTSDGSAGFYAIAALSNAGLSEAEVPALLVSGTTEVVMMPLYGEASSVETAPGLVVNPVIASLVPGACAVIGGSTGMLGGVLRHLGERFGSVIFTDPATLEDEAATLPPGAGGLMVVPSLEGERLPRSIPGKTAAVLGADAATGPAALARAVWEAGAYRVNGILEEIRRSGASAPAEIRVGGGGGANALWNQIRADVTGIPVRSLPWMEAPSVGATWIALAALGENPADYAVREDESRLWVPDGATGERYRRLEARYRERAVDLARYDRENEEDLL